MKKLVAVVLTLLFVFPVSAYGEQATLTPSQETTRDEMTIDPISFRIATDNAETSNVGRAYAKFEELVEERSGGAIQVDVYYGGVMGSVDECVEQVQMGAIECCNAATGTLGSLDVDFTALALPYVWIDRDDAINTFNNILSDVCVKKAEALGLKLFPFAMYDGTRCYYVNGHSVKTVADCAGIKMRVADRQTYILPAKAVGMVPVAMSFNEAFMAVQQGTVDGLESVISQGMVSSLYDICDGLILDKHIISMYFTVMNPNFWNSLTEVQQNIITDCMKEATEYEVEFAFEQEDGSISDLEAHGMTMYYVDVEEFMAACEGAREELATNIAPDFLALILDR